MVTGKGFGFLEPEGQTGQSVYLHFSNVVPKVSVREFDNMQGSTFLLVVQTGSKGKSPEAKLARLIESK